MENTEIIDKIVEVTPAATPKVSWKQFGVGAAVVCAVGALAAGAYYVIKKFTKGEEQDEAVDNVKVAQHDFVEEEESEE